MYDSFDELPPGYCRLFDDIAKINLSASLSWFRTFERAAIEEGAALRLYGVEAADAEARIRTADPLITKLRAENSGARQRSPIMRYPSAISCRRARAARPATERSQDARSGPPGGGGRCLPDARGAGGGAAGAGGREARDGEGLALSGGAQAASRTATSIRLPSAA